MGVFNFIKVELLVNDSALPEYLDPDPGNDHRYVQARAGQEYTLKLTLLKGFERMGSNIIQLAMICDGSINNRRSWTESIRNAPWKAGRLQKDHVVKHVTFMRGFDQATQQWNKYAFSFKPLVTDEGDVKGYAGAATRELGSIVVTVSRMGAEQLVISEFDTWNVLDSPDSVPEKVLKGADIHATTTFKKGEVTKPPTRRSYKKLPGHAGREHEFKFLYRSRIALQHLGLIARDPVREPQFDILTQIQVNTLKRQVADLQAEARKRKRQEQDGPDGSSDVEEVAPPAKKWGEAIEISDDEE